MAIDYNQDWTKSLTNALSTIGQVDAASPKVSSASSPATNITGLATSAGATSPFGMSPEDTTKTFDQAYGSATTGYDPFPKTGVKKDINQLQGLYDQVPDAFDVSGTLRAIDAARGAALTTGTQAANTAATKFETSQIPGAATGPASSMLRASALLPYVANDTAQAASEGQYADSAKQNALAAAAGIAEQLANLNQSYTNSLASYNSNKAQFGLNAAGSKTSSALAASTASTNAQLAQRQQDIQNSQFTTSQQAQQNALAEQTRQANLSAALATQQAQSQAAQTAKSQQITAANSVLTNKTAPSGSWTTDNSGRVTSGQSDYKAYQDYLAGRTGAASTLAKIAA